MWVVRVMMKVERVSLFGSSSKPGEHASIVRHVAAGSWRWRRKRRRNAPMSAS
jgi:hypothetical protein